jgi:hypothetical protein
MLRRQSASRTLSHGFRRELGMVDSDELLDALINSPRAQQGNDRLHHGCDPRRTAVCWEHRKEWGLIESQSPYLAGIGKGIGDGKVPA